MTSWPNWVWSSRAASSQSRKTLPSWLPSLRTPGCELLPPCCCAPCVQAVYQADNIGHFGLALKSLRPLHLRRSVVTLTSFCTAPSVPDWQKGQQGNLRHKWTPSGGYHYQLEEVDPMGEHCSMTERRADDATRDVADWLKVRVHAGSRG